MYLLTTIVKCGTSTIFKIWQKYQYVNVIVEQKLIYW